MNNINIIKKKFEMPHSHVMIVGIVLIAAILTWIVPAGQFQRVKDETSGQMLVVADQFKFVERSGVSLLSIPLRLVKGLIASSDILILVLVAGGAFSVIISTGVVQALVTKLGKIFVNKEFLIVIAFTTIFALACTTMGVITFIGFVPLGIIVARSLGYDAMVGTSMVCLGGAVGFSTGAFMPLTTGVAQSIAGLPLFSGLWYRLVSLVVFLIVTNVFLVRYANIVKKQPHLSIVRDLELEAEKQVTDTQIGATPSTNFRHYLVAFVVIAGFAFIVYGGWKLKFGLQEISAQLIWMALLSGLCGGLSMNTIANKFINGSKNLVFGALLVGFARAISDVLTDGKILDTSIFYLSNLLSFLPNFMQASAMFVMHLIINAFIISGSGQAAVTMPIMLPVGDIIGITRQTAVLAFNFGDGLSNFILPMSSVLMGFLGVAGIGYDRWLKFIWKLFVIWIITGIVLVSIARFIRYGPF